MANHLLVQTAHANLSEFMRHFLVTYTGGFNRRNGRSGHVFQGRFKSLLVEEDEYLLAPPCIALPINPGGLLFCLICLCHDPPNKKI
jgi:hypothetical protein